MKQTEPLVVIAGAGPVGLALALGLSVHGVRSIVLERKAELSKHSRAAGILSRTLEIFKQWGVLGPFEDLGVRLRRAQVHRADTNRPVATVNWELLADETATPGILILPQGDTEALLLRWATVHGRSEVRFGHTVTGFMQDADGVSVMVQPPEGEPYTVRGAYLVGCDGAHSAVREQLGWRLEGKTYGTRFLLADVSLPDARNELPWPRFLPDDRGFEAAIRLSADVWRIIAPLVREQPDEDALAAPALDRRVEALFGPGPYTPVWSSVFRIHCRTSPHFRSGRVMLAGDAAHLNSPVGGQGMNGGIQDAHNLAWKLARAMAGGDAEPLLASYEAERRAVVLHQIERTTDWATRMVLLPAPRARALVARLVRAAIARPALMRRLARRMGMLDLTYLHSPIITGAGPHLGHRAPDGEVMDGDGYTVRLHDLVGPHALVVLFDDGRFPLWPPGQVENWVAGMPGVRVARVLPRSAQPATGWFWDCEARLWETYHAGVGTAVLIRPDGVVGWRGDRPTMDALMTGVAVGVGVPHAPLTVRPSGR
jgi:2-polyprenyl-6-methoxyphenol hydroxylase-like FAD-dependent oxidoreductase